MTFPSGSSNYAVAVGSAASLVPIFIARDPNTNDISYPVQQRWINTLTQGIWVLETFSSAGGVVTAQWRALAPIVIKTVDPTTSDYLYPLGQTWLNTSNSFYWVLLSVSGTTATWAELSSGGQTGIDSLAPDSGTNPVVPTAGGLVTMSGSGSITTVGGTNTLTTELTGLTNHNVLVGAGTTTITKVAPSATSGIPLISQGASSDPIFGSATVPGGGTGAGSFTAHGVLIGEGTSPIVATSPGTANQVFVSGGASADPLFSPSFSVATASPGTVALLTGSTVANQVLLEARNLDSTSALSSVRVALVTGGLGTGDYYMIFDNTAGSLYAYEMGVQSSSNTFQIQVQPANTNSNMDGTTALSVNSSGNVTMPLGFGVDGTHFITAYTSGTFTPALAFGGLSVGITYSLQFGKYWRIGSVIFYSINIVLTSKGSSTGSATVTGLPFTSANDGATNLASVSIATVTLDAGYTVPTAFVQDNATIVDLQEIGSAQTTRNLADTNFANTSQITFSGTYWVT